jgi:hypothetical protein
MCRRASRRVCSTLFVAFQHPCACDLSPPSLQLWPAANFINFRFVPPEQRILYVNAVYIGWVSFLVSGARVKAGWPGPQ